MAASIPFQISANEQAFDNLLQANMQQFKLIENKINQNQALARVPIEDLKAIAQARYESSDKPNGDSTIAEKIVKDMFLMELMEWFKNDFFTWMNSPPCPRCQKPTVGIGSGVPTSLEMSMSAGRVELFTCSSCFSDRREVARFPRYNNPVVLLDTKTGRCGEWANCFALICRAAGFEIRHVHDHTDHVWVEVFSSSLNPNRWVHVDPCENSYDNPLLYEVGWGKKLTYIIAVSQDDIQDVTPRYCVDFKNALGRRTQVRESWLVNRIVQLRNELQANLPESRKFELQQRWIQEIVELITPKDSKSVKDSEKAGRESGSLAWRLARQELGDSMSDTKPSGFIWTVEEKTVFDGRFELKYDCGLDMYSRKNEKGENVFLNGWQNGIFATDDVFRKEERDWKMVYLAMKENALAPTSKLAWQFQLQPEYTIEDIKITVKYSIFKSDAQFSLKLGTENMDKNAILLETNAGDQLYTWNSKSSSEAELLSRLRQSKTITVICELTKGSGNDGWQKVQLFRQQLTSGKPLSALDNNSFCINFEVKKIN